LEADTTADFRSYVESESLLENGSRQHLVFKAKEVWSRLKEVQGLQQWARFDQEIPPEPVQAVLPRVRQGHRLPEAGLVLKFQPVLSNFPIGWSLQ
jgi:hypothetical protein